MSHDAMRKQTVTCKCGKQHRLTRAAFRDMGNSWLCWECSLQLSVKLGVLSQAEVDVVLNKGVLDVK